MSVSIRGFFEGKPSVSAPPPIITPASVVGIAATVPQTLRLLRSLKYSAQGIVAFGEVVEDVEAVEVDAKRARGECATALEIAPATGWLVDGFTAA